MSKYVLVNNKPNQIATVHFSDCPHLGSNPLMQTASAERTPFDDGLEALMAASATKTFVLCGHCLVAYRDLLSKLRG
jgi:hypothetical protein